MIWTLLAFGATLYLLNKLAFPRIAEALDKRRKAIEDSIEHAEQAKREADELLEEYRARLREAREQADDIVVRARKAAEGVTDESKAQASKQREELLEATRRDIEAETRRALERDPQGGRRPHRDRHREGHAQVADPGRPPPPDRGSAGRGRLLDAGGQGESELGHGRDRRGLRARAVRGGQGRRRPRPRARRAGPVRRRARRGPQPAGLLVLALLLERGEEAGRAAHRDRRRRAPAQLPRAARRAPSHAGAVPDPAHLRRSLGRGEQAPVRHRDQRYRARPGPGRRHRQAHRGADRPAGRALLERRPRRPRRPASARREHGPRRDRAQPPRTTSKASRPRPLKETPAKVQINPDEITSILKERIQGLEDGGADLSEVGTVLSVADGISRVHGLDNVMSTELLELPHDVTGLALNLESDNVGVVLFGEWDKIEEGDQVKRTGRLLEVPVGDALLGRIVDPLGRPLDGKGDINTSETRPAEFKAPGVVARQPVKEPMLTGIKPIDAMTNVGRGQRELIIGDRQTGKTSICIDTIINNKGKDLKCVYVAIGQRMSTVVDVAQQLDDARRARPHDHRGGACRRGRADQVPRPLRGRGDRGALPLQRRPRAGDLRRPDQARVRLSADVAAAAPPARPRGLPGRRLLPALAAARALGEALRRARRRLVHRAADHRDAGGRRVGLHPDQRHLDHRRPDLPRGGPVPLGRAAGDQRRHLGVARGRLGADDADAEGGRQAAPGAVAVPRARGVRAVRLGPRRRHAGHAQPRRPPRRGAQPGRAPPGADRGPGGRRSTRAPAATSTASRSSASRSSSSSCSRGCTPRTPT